MKVINQGQEMFVSWSYETVKNKSLPGHALQNVTNVTVSKKENDKYVPIETTSVRKYHKDRENRDKARKFALKKVLGQLFPSARQKNERATFWDAYKNRVNQTT